MNNICISCMHKNVKQKNLRILSWIPLLGTVRESRMHLCYVHTFLLQHRVGVVAYRPIKFTHSWFCVFHLWHAYNECKWTTYGFELPTQFTSLTPFAAREREREKKRHILHNSFSPTHKTDLLCCIFFALHLHHLHSSTFFFSRSPTFEEQFLENPTVKLLWILFA